MKHAMAPAKPATRAIYFAIFGDYATKHMTLAELAEKYGYKDITHICQIIKWASKELEASSDHSIHAQLLHADINKSLQILDNQISSLLDQNDGIAAKREDMHCLMEILGEARRTKELVAKINGLMKPDIDNSRKTVNVMFGDFKMKEGNNEKNSTKATTGPRRSSDRFSSSPVLDGEWEQAPDSEPQAIS